MKKTAFFIVLLISLANLCACSEQTESKSITEAKIIDENLNLKDQIAELQVELALKEQQEIDKKEAENIVLAFFQQIFSGRIDEVENMISNQIQIADSSLTLKDGSEVTFPNDNSYFMSFSDSKWDGANSVCMSLAISKRETQSSLKVYLIKEDGVWKIDNITS
ncbi:hypothetical protein IEO70_14395 [Bacillus sp. AGMB 02131]|uniref:DUF4878 domain-containing protein n=1 Tax=Peribacillus faecalis TaxID=2772559 RepID=A0A927HBA5_9BACI|nr:hypothetical protein [Peribacillus faecalis]MBD3109535.1 hypothetical protein [Peribacillus faecalis]